MKSWTRPLLWCSLASLLVILPGCYLSEQAQGQLRLSWQQVPLAEAQAQTQDPRIQKLLALVPKIKAFGQSRMGLKPSANFEGYFATEQEGITFVVTASPQDRLEAYQWWFPILGDLPYKGYFDPTQAQALAQEMESQGYDVWIFAAPAYSTLGWFKDPVTTPMLKQGAWGLSQTILHEMVHDTLFVKNQADFNEQLASFVGSLGAWQFLQEAGQLDQAQKERIQAHQALQQKIQESMKASLPRLEAIYAEPGSQAERRAKALAAMQELEQELNHLAPGRDWSMNNARLLQARRYQPQSPLFQAWWQESQQSWPGFWQKVQQHVQEQGW